MIIKKGFVFAVILLFFGLAITPHTYSKSSNINMIDDNFPITPEDEGDHYPIGYEIWFYHASLIFEDGQHWDTLATFVYFMNKDKDGYTNGSSFIRNRIWNRETGECFDYFQPDDFPGEFKTTKNEVNLAYYNSSGEGLYPNYHFYIDDDVHNIKTDLNFHATSYPCWLAEESMNRTIPTGFNGFCSAYFIPLLEVEGSVTINGNAYNVTGIAYFEHDFADYYSGNPFYVFSFKEVYKNLRLTSSYSIWLVKQVIFNRPRVAPSWHRSSDNMAGWIWKWMVFENGWSIVIFLPAIICVSGGVVPVFLYLSKDGVNYSEFGCVNWRNIREKYVKRAGIYIPIEYEIIGRKGDTEFCIKYNSTTGITALYGSDWSPDSNMDSVTFYSCGDVTGYGKDENGEVQLYGHGAFEQTRVFSKFIKHRSRDIELILPPKGLGISFKFRSHYLGYERFLKIQIRPLDIEFYIKRITIT